MADIISSILWDEAGSEDKWLLSASQVVTSTDNLGIPGHPYVHKVYIDLSSLSSVGESFFSDSNTDTLEDLLTAHIQASASYVRPVMDEDMLLPTLSDLSSSIFDRLSVNPYGTLSFSKLVQADTDPLESPAVTTTLTVSGELSFSRLVRNPENEHLPLDGWYYFRAQTVAEDYFVYDKAKEALSRIEYCLGWKTTRESGRTYLPLNAGVSSVVPASREFSVGSKSVSGLLAGDYIKITVSGGSGEYTVEPASGSESLLSKESKNTWRVLENASVATLEINDTNIETERATITLTTTEPS